jgi:hypothetical protein
MGDVGDNQGPVVPPPSPSSPARGCPRGSRRRHCPEEHTPREFDEHPTGLQATTSSRSLAKETFAIKIELGEALAAEKMQYCPCCKERWFGAGLKADGVCKHDKENKKHQDKAFSSAANRFDFCPGPRDLPRLGPLEEMFAARTHVSVDVSTVGGEDGCEGE